MTTDLQTPNVLQGEALQEWVRIMGDASIRKFEASDVAALTAYCIAVGHMIDAEQDIKTSGLHLTNSHGNRYANPSLKTLKEQSGIIATLTRELGFTPKSRGGSMLKRGQMPASMRKALGR